MNGKKNHAGCPEAVLGLDLELPALLEASAGTGKTFAIEHLVLRILKEIPDIDFPQILALTFTEKAAGELKDKIRRRLALELELGNVSDGEREDLKRAYLNFDRAAIFTIHGFCLRVLGDHAFGNGALFRSKLADDGEVLDAALTEEMRAWQIRDGSGPEAEAAFRERTSALNVKSEGHWRRNLLSLARSYDPFREDKLLPVYDPVKVKELEAAILDFFRNLTRLLGNGPKGKEHPWYLSMEDAVFEKVPKKDVLEIAKNLLTLVDACADNTETEVFDSVQIFFKSITKTPAKNGRFEFLSFYRKPKRSKKGDPFAPDENALWEDLDELIVLLHSLHKAVTQREAELASRKFIPYREIIPSLQRRAREFKASKGSQSYDDMIRNLCEALRKKPELIAALRKQYRYCIVDEFQDTDPLQWEIFETVFLDSQGKNPLYLVGDPKQAIYGFRGGDVHTYLRARKSLYDLSRKGEAQGFGLNANFRSSRALVEACNVVFPQSQWFEEENPDPKDQIWKIPPEPNPRGYQKVKHGGLAIQECQDASAHSAPVILRDFSGETRQDPLRKGLCDWITAEITLLMAEPESLRIPDGRSGAFRPLHWGDICVLTGTHSEKSNVERAFRKAGIPYQIFKQPGLYQSEEASHLTAVLESLADPRNASKYALALLTRFFRSPFSAPSTQRPEDRHPLFEIWSRLAERRQWQRFVHSLLYDGGLLYRESLEEDKDRRIMNFLHLGQNLAESAARENLSLDAVVETFRSRRKNADDDEAESDLHREDSEGDKVVLMTMHASKGLEFPVVFLAGVSAGQSPKFLRYHEAGNEGRTFHLNADDAQARPIFDEQNLDEKRRLYYVAFTRARYKLYIPVTRKSHAERAIEQKKDSPLKDFISDSLRASEGERPDLFHWSRIDADRIASRRRVRKRPMPLGGDDSKRLKGFFEDFADFKEDDSLSGPEADFSRRKRGISSYSRLAHSHPAPAVEGPEGRYDKEDSLPVPDVAAEADVSTDAGGDSAPAAPDTLPGGREIGNMFHEILEEVDFSFAAAAQSTEALLAHPPSLSLIAARMNEHRLAPEHLPRVAEVVRDTLQASIPDVAGGPPFRLGDVRERKHELEFLFPHPSGNAHAGGYLHGYIDLVFRRDGRYYLLDWKSNRLDGYGKDAVERSMRESRYDLQYKLYALALEKWLRSLLPDYDFDRHFGGIYYVYLRGMRAGSDAAAPAGWFGLRPTAEQMNTEFPAALNEAWNAAAAFARAGKGRP